MKLVVLGASGGCGRHLVRLGVARGHEVTAVARDASKVSAPGARVLAGDLTSASFLREAVRGHDAVLSALGLKASGFAPWSSVEAPDFLDRSTAALIEAMKAEGVRRVMAISSGGVGDSYAAMPGAFKAVVSASVLRKVFPALERMENAYLASGLDVCIARPSGLTDEPATGRVVVATRYAGRATIPREDVAGWMLDQIEKPSFAARTPMITVTGVA